MRQSIVRRATLLLALAASSAGAQSAHVLTPAELQSLDAYVEHAKQQWGSDVPGLSLAIVQGDSVVYTKGYGVREVGKPERVDAHTLFAIGSNTKSMTAALVGMLVDDGKMRWDDAAWTYLPGFRVADPYVSREATIRDLLSHRTDVENNLSVWYRSPLSRAQLLERLRFLKQEGSFRSHFLYNNLMVMTAGEAAAAVAGRPWEELLRQRLFTPLGMRESLTSSRELTPASDVAAPHMQFDGALVAVPHVDASNIGPAGSVYSNAVDMAQYLRLQIGHGVYRGTRLVSDASVAQMRTVTTPIGTWQATVPDSDVTVAGYGLCWLIESFRGHRLIRHNGSIDGYLADMQVLPDDRIGVVVLTNQMTRPLPEAIVNHVLDVALGLRPRDWNGEAVARAKAQDAQVAARARAQQTPQSQSAAGVGPMLPLERYAGTYSDSLRGDVTIRLADGKLVLAYHPGLTATLEPLRYNTFRLAWQRPNVYANGTSLATFTVDDMGRPTDVTVNVMGTFHAAAPSRGARTVSSGQQ